MSDAGDQLKELLGPLCSTDQDRRILEELADACVEFDDEMIVFEDGDGDEWECEYGAGSGAPEHDDVPASFRRIADTLEFIAWDGGGPEVGFALAEDGSSVADEWLFDEVEEDDPELHAKIVAAGGAKPAFMAGQNGLFFDPLRKLSNGEPALAFISHEGGGWEHVESVDNLNYPQILLRLIAQSCAQTGDYIPEVYF